MHSPHRVHRLPARAAWVFFAALLMPAACLAKRDVPVHGWWNERGPVVRHESFPEDCTLCHKGLSWTDLVQEFEFDHLLETGFELQAAHASAQCLRCHNDRGPVQVFERQGCGGCHADIHHRLLGDNCEACHGQEDWQPEGQIAEHRKTRFALTGVHLVTPCWRCHDQAQEGVFVLEDLRCESCHQTDLARAVDPNHVELQWTADCERCHYASEWRGAQFGHESLGANCMTCHFDDFRQAQRPVHVAAWFPQTCEFCHTLDSWNPAYLDHPWPRVLIHRQFDCELCHTRIGDFKSFSCTHCHWHDSDVEALRHKTVTRYVWVNPECVACHPTGH